MARLCLRKQSRDAFPAGPRPKESKQRDPTTYKSTSNIHSSHKKLPHTTSNHSVQFRSPFSWMVDRCGHRHDERLNVSASAK